MPYHHSTYDWFWMIPMMISWLLALGVIIYAAIRLAEKHSSHGRGR